MKKSAILSLLFCLSLTAFAQKPRPIKKNPFNPAKTEKVPVNPGNEKEDFDKALALTDAAERINALKKFIVSFPGSAEKNHARELIVVTYAQLGDEKLKNNETEEGVKSFRLAVANLPEVISDKLFTEILLQIPSALFLRGQREAAFETARTIESKIGGNANQMLGLATFYLGVENGVEAARLADSAIKIDPNSAAAYQTAGNASRLSFQLEDSARAYAKSLELNGNSTAARRSLAEMKRAVGRPGEAAVLYREILAKEENNTQAQTGLVLSLFDDDKQTEAETEMAKALAQNPKNLSLLVGAAYWYAAHNDGAKAVDLAGQASRLEPRYIWARIALARGYSLQKRPLDAEKELLTARQYGNFPTLVYELASVRLQAGFFREAAELLKTDFTVKDDLLTVKLGGRVEKEAKTFIELLAPERRASIFEPLAADSPENADRLKSLLDFAQKLDASETDDAAISQAADAFISGDEPMKLHRQLFVARQLLGKRRALPKITEIAQAALGKADAALNVPNPAAAVLADAMYDSRALAATKNEVVIVPDIPRPTLSAILRGEIEEVAGWAAYQQNQTGDAVIHLKRAVSVLPEKSLFWHSSMWRLGSALAADGHDKEALDAYLKSYQENEASAFKYSVVEALYKKVNGSTDGLEAKIGAKPALLFNTAEDNTAPAVTAQNAPPAAPAESSPSPAVKPAEPVKTIEETAKTAENPVPAPIVNEQPKENLSALAEAPKENPKETPAVTENSPKTSLPAEDLPKTAPEDSSAAAAKNAPVENTPADNPEIKPAAKPEIKPEIKAADQPAAQPANNPEIKTEAQPEVKPEAASPSPSASPENKPAEQIAEKAVSGSPSQAASQPKPLFEPIIIQVPSSTKPAAPDSAVPKNTLKIDENTAPPVSDQPAAPDAGTEVKTPPAETPVPDLSRPRVVITYTNPSAAPANQKCSLVANQENVTLINNGGSLGLIVGFENPADAGEITASSSSPENVSVRLDEGFGPLSGRSLFIIKSNTPNAGEYKVTFEAPCGKKEILVRVR